MLILGRAASGKSTLLKALAGLLRPQGGRVRWEGDDVWELPSEERRRRQAAIGLVFQTDALFDSLTVRDNVALPLLNRHVEAAEAQRRADEVLERVGLLEVSTRLPEQLSGGQRKRAGLARALVAQPPVLLADDPFAGLDPRSAAVTGRLFADLAQQRTLIVAAAEPPEALTADRWLVLSCGQLVHDGAPLAPGQPLPEATP